MEFGSGRRFMWFGRAGFGFRLWWVEVQIYFLGWRDG